MSQTKQSGAALVIQRLLRVPREQVFAAWLDPVSVAQWMKAGGVDHVTADLDPRVGGTFRIVMRHAGKDVEHRGERRTILGLIQIEHVEQAAVRQFHRHDDIFGNAPDVVDA